MQHNSKKCYLPDNVHVANGTFDLWFQRNTEEQNCTRALGYAILNDEINNIRAILKLQGKKLEKDQQRLSNSNTSKWAPVC